MSEFVSVAKSLGLKEGDDEHYSKRQMIYNLIRSGVLFTQSKDIDKSFIQYVESLKANRGSAFSSMIVSGNNMFDSLFLFIETCDTILSFAPRILVFQPSKLDKLKQELASLELDVKHGDEWLLDTEIPKIKEDIAKQEKAQANGGKLIINNPNTKQDISATVSAACHASMIRLACIRVILQRMINFAEYDRDPRWISNVINLTLVLREADVASLSAINRETAKLSSLRINPDFAEPLLVIGSMSQYEYLALVIMMLSMKNIRKVRVDCLYSFNGLIYPKEITMATLNDMLRIDMNDASLRSRKAWVNFATDEENTHKPSVIIIAGDIGHRLENNLRDYWASKSMFDIPVINICQFESTDPLTDCVKAAREVIDAATRR